MFKRNANIYLWGFMAAGKSRLGKRLAAKLNRQFIDLDAYIEEKEQATIPEIFAQQGETYFRQLETQYLEQITQLNQYIIACGGGTPCFNNNKNYMLQNGVVVFLTVNPEVLYDRLWRNRDSRPLIASFEEKEDMIQYINNLFAGRKAYYSQAHVEYDNSFPKSDLSDLVEVIQTGTTESPTS